MKKVVVTRHQGLIKYLKQFGYIEEDTPILKNLHPDEVRDCWVLGYFPVHLAYTAKHITRFKLLLRTNVELSTDEIKGHIRIIDMDVPPGLIYEINKFSYARSSSLQVMSETVRSNGMRQRHSRRKGYASRRTSKRDRKTLQLAQFELRQRRTVVQAMYRMERQENEV